MIAKNIVKNKNCIIFLPYKIALQRVFLKKNLIKFSGLISIPFYGENHKVQSLLEEVLFEHSIVTIPLK